MRATLTFSTCQNLPITQIVYVCKFTCQNETIYKVSKKKTLWKFNRLLCITNSAKLTIQCLHRTKELLGTGHKVTARVGWSDLGNGFWPWKIFGQLWDGPPIFLYVHGWATKQKLISTFITYYVKYNSKYDFKVKHNTNLTGLYTVHRDNPPPPPRKFN